MPVSLAVPGLCAKRVSANPSAKGSLTVMKAWFATKGFVFSQNAAMPVRVRMARSAMPVSVVQGARRATSVVQALSVNRVFVCLNAMQPLIATQV